MDEVNSTPCVTEKLDGVTALGAQHISRETKVLDVPFI
jgi:hypothetical protein